MDNYTYAHHEGVTFRTDGDKIQKKVYDEITERLKLEEFIELLQTRTVHLEDVYVYPEQWQYEEDDEGCCIGISGWETVYEHDYEKALALEFT